MAKVFQAPDRRIVADFKMASDGCYVLISYRLRAWTTSDFHFVCRISGNVVEALGLPARSAFIELPQLIIDTDAGMTNAAANALARFSTNSAEFAWRVNLKGSARSKRAWPYSCA